MIKRILTVFFLVLLFLTVAAPAFAAPVITERCDPKTADSPNDTDTLYCSSTTNAITASYATMGYWTLGAMLQKFGGIDQAASNNGALGGDGAYLKTIGAFIFILSFFAAVIMMALGQPPKMYGWFAAAPGIMYFMLFNLVQRDGVAWEIGGTRQDQTVVWELAYTGLKNPLISETADGGITDAYRKSGASYGVYVPWLFAKIDDVSTEVIQNIVGLMGIRGDLPADRHEGAKPTDVTNWPLLSTEKWEIMENITGAKITNNDLRELLVQYMSSECGDKMSEYLNKGAFAKASSSTGINLPKTLFTSTPDTWQSAPTSIESDCSSGNDKAKLLCELNKLRLPAPYAFKQLLKKETNDNANPGFSQFAFSDGMTSPPSNKPYEASTVTCDDWLWMIMTGIRWESALHYINLRASLDLPVSADSVKQDVIKTDVMDFVFTYDWEFLKSDGEEEPIASGEQRQQFMLHMIMAYMIRNEFALAPQMAEQNLLPSARSANYAEEFSRTTNSKNKFAEVYTWAKMLPHVQGMILYLLSIAYPLACVMILVPGWWKWIITWSSFYIWAKSWDAGFAIVQNIEKSIWANLGNSNNVASLNYNILKLDFPNDQNSSNTVNFVFGTDGKATSLLQGVRLTEGYALDLFDRGLILSRALNHDLVNAYYIYLMSALYFAVPAVTGQLLLGAKSGMANMVKEGIGGVSSEGGSAARSGAVAEETRHGTMNNMAAEQTFNAKAGRQDGLALRALQAKNNAMGLEMASGAMQARSSLMDQGAQSRSDMSQIAEARMGQRMGTWGVVNAEHKAHMSALGRVGGAGESEMERWARNQNTGVSSSSPNTAQSNPSGAGANTSGAANQGKGPITHGTNKAQDAAKAILGPGDRYASEYASHLSGIADAQLAEQKAGQNVALTTQALDAKQLARNANVAASMGQFALGNQARASSESASRLSQEAGFNARESAYREGAKFSSHMSGMMAARGVVAGAFDPKDKPKDLESMGAGGMLGSGYSQAYSYPSNGFLTDLGGQVSSLSPAVSYASQNYNAGSGSYGLNFDKAVGSVKMAENYAMASVAGNAALDAKSWKSFGNGLLTTVTAAGAREVVEMATGEDRNVRRDDLAPSVNK